MVPFGLVKQLDSAILMTQIYKTGTYINTTSVCSIRKHTSVIDDSCRPRISLPFYQNQIILYTFLDPNNYG